MVPGGMKERELKAVAEEEEEVEVASEDEDEDVLFDSDDFEEDSGDEGDYALAGDRRGKKRKKQSGLSSDGEGSGGPSGLGSEGGAAGGSDDEDIETHFEFFDPSEGDFLGLKGLLNAYLDGETYDCSGLVDAIVGQPTVGRVVRLEEQLDPIAVVSVVNLRKQEHAQFLQDVLAFLQASAPTQRAKDQLARHVTGPNVKKEVSAARGNRSASERAENLTSLPTQTHFQF